MLEFQQGRKLKILSAWILECTKNGQILLAWVQAIPKNGQILFARILESTKKGIFYLLELQQGRKLKFISTRILECTKNGQILFARILARKKSENPIC